MSLAHLHPKANICAKFHENWWKTEEVVRDARFPPHFCNNMPLPWQHSFCHCQKMCLAHLHPKANICAKFHENWSKTEEVVRDARLAPNRPPTRPPDRRHADSYIPPYTLRVCGGIIKRQGTEELIWKESNGVSGLWPGGGGGGGILCRVPT